MKKRLMCFMLSAILLVGSGLSVSAAPQKMKDGTIFDPEYYAEQNPDVVAAMGKGTKALYRHYVNHGKAEGRKATADSEEDFDAAFYARTYPDVVAVYGTDAAALYRHYIDYGRAEGRRPSADSTGAAVFDAAFYAKTYPDVVAVYGTDAAALYRHYVDFGKAEGRKPCADNETSVATAAASSAAAAAPQETPKPGETQQPQETPKPGETQQPQETPKPEEPQQPQGPTENIPSTDQLPAVSNNADAQNYRWYNNYNWNWAETVKSFLYENQSGGLTRVEYNNGQIVVEDYDNDFRLCASRNIPAELPIWGGFFAGENYNFVIFGQENESQDDSREVVRVVKYSKTWERLGQASLYGANTTVPFDAGSLRCAEYGDYLYIRTCHEMYQSPDGRNHQANLTLAVRQSEMTLTDSYHIVMNSGVGYVSHSFNQFVLVDQNQNIVTLDHGDAYPRGIVLMRYNDAKAGGDKFSGEVTSSLLVTFPGQTGDNYTGAAIGGFAETASGYVTAFNYDGIGGGGTREIYIGYTAKDGMSSTVNKITEGGEMRTPVLVSSGLDGGFLMWNDANGTFYYARYGNEGEVGSIVTVDAALSDCQPICHDGKIVWYVTSNSVPKFFELDMTSGEITATIANER